MAKEYVEQRDGGYFVAGTRVSLDSVVYAFREGESPETIRENFATLTLEKIHGSLAYYLANRQTIDAYLLRQEQLYEERRKAAPPLPEDLQKRLTAARQELLASHLG